MDAEYHRKYRQENKEKRAETLRKYYAANKEQILETKRKYKEKNKEVINKKRRVYYLENKEQFIEYRENNKERINKNYRVYMSTRMEADPLFKAKHHLRTNITCSFGKKGYTKNSKTFEILGADWEVVKEHIENLFTKGMTWDNHGEWHYDHIIPLRIAQSTDDVNKLCHYTNYQPLWKTENLIKRDKLQPEWNTYKKAMDKLESNKNQVIIKNK